MDKNEKTSTEQRLLIINLVKKYKDIIENKKTDQVTTIDKKKCWETISKEFNSQQLSHKTAKQLKTCYNNMKLKHRKEAAERKRDVMRTGGGPATIKKETQYSAIAELVDPGITASSNPFDDDGDTEEVCVSGVKSLLLNFNIIIHVN